MSQLHIRYDGQSMDLAMENLDIGDLSTDRQIRQAVALHLETPQGKLDDFSIDRNEATGDITLRPQAVFG